MIAQALLASSARRPQLWLGCAMALCLPAITKATQGMLGPWIGTQVAPQMHLIVLLYAVYIGASAHRASASLLDRLAPGRRLGTTGLVVGTNVAVISLCGWVGTWAANMSLGALASGPVPWLWSTVIVGALTTALVAHARTPGRCLLLAVAVLWWIPAVLPPSLLLAVPRALRLFVADGPAIAAPGELRAWMADTALVAGLLLLAWAPRRRTPRGNEVRHPG